MAEREGGIVTTIYDVILKRHQPTTKSNVCIFYDTDREAAIKEMGKYVKNHGFTITEKTGTFTIANVVLREREATGTLISETSYCELFDFSGKRKVK